MSHFTFSNSFYDYPHSCVCNCSNTLYTSVKIEINIGSDLPINISLTKPMNFSDAKKEAQLWLNKPITKELAYHYNKYNNEEVNFKYNYEILSRYTWLCGATFKNKTLILNVGTSDAAFDYYGC